MLNSHEAFERRKATSSATDRAKLETAMSQNSFPDGWNEERIRNVIAHYERQTEEEAIAEDEAGVEPTGAGIAADSGVLDFPFPESLVEEKLVAVAEDGEKPHCIVGGNWPSTIPGAWRTSCQDCGKYLAISPNSSGPIIDRWPDVPILCIDCVRVRTTRD